MNSKSGNGSDTVSYPQIVISELMRESGVSFGTSGVRGLVSAMSDGVCAAYTQAFLSHLEQTGQIGDRLVAIGRDLRPSSDRISRACQAAVLGNEGYRVIDCGEISSPALALYGRVKGIPTIMVTGSHIPDDRNGIKFCTPKGEITKQDEVGIVRQSVTVQESQLESALRLSDVRDHSVVTDASGNVSYRERYKQFFGEGFLDGMKIGVYQHSAVIRDELTLLMEELGAQVTILGRSEQFIPVDTEAVRSEDVIIAREWARSYRLDAIVSADGDSDRPLISDEMGEWLRGDIAGILTARYLGVNRVVTPVSSNSALEKCGWFERTVRTRIGSPYVIAEMERELAEGGAIVAGYEANGGFLLGSPIVRGERRLEALPTRDAVIVHLSILGLARERKVPVSKLQGELPARFTHSDRIKDLPTAISLALLAEFDSAKKDSANAAIEALLGDLCGTVATTDLTDGVRITFANEEIVHFRPSGNAPEMRCYTEATTPGRAEQINRDALSRIGGRIRSRMVS